jgi:hypothetical protein
VEHEHHTLNTIHSPNFSPSLRFSITSRLAHLSGSIYSTSFDPYPLLQSSSQEKFQLPTNPIPDFSGRLQPSPTQSSQGASKKSTMVQTAPPSKEAETQKPKMDPTNNNTSRLMSPTYDFRVSGALSNSSSCEKYYHWWIGMAKGGGRRITDH